MKPGSVVPVSQQELNFHTHKHEESPARSRNSVVHLTPEEHEAGSTELSVRAQHQVGQPRTLLVSTVEILQLSEINDVSQRFTVQFFLQLRFPGGAHDKHLAAKDADGNWRKDFPLQPDGRPTFLPPAGWYLEQVDLNNALNYNKMDESIFLDGDDICISMRMEGTFFEELELGTFPFDLQSLTIEIAINVRKTGKTPINLVVAKDVDKRVVAKGFQLENTWRLLKESKTGYDIKAPGHLDLTSFLWGEPGRQFPSLAITAIVIRKGGYYTANIFAPMFMFVVLSFTHYTVPRKWPADRLSITLTLVLTAAAYKFAVTALVPSISYLTLLDKYVFFSWGCIMLNALEGGFVSTKVLDDGVLKNFDNPELKGDLIDYIAGGAIAAFWIACAAASLERAARSPAALAPLRRSHPRRTFDRRRQGHLFWFLPVSRQARSAAAQIYKQRKINEDRLGQMSMDGEEEEASHRASGRGRGGPIGVIVQR